MSEFFHDFIHMPTPHLVLALVGIVSGIMSAISEIRAEIDNRKDGLVD